MDLRAWLGCLGLERYEAVFRANRIDSDVLSELTESDLEKLDIPLGDRKRLLKAIRTLGIETPAAQEVRSPASPQTQGELRDGAERRQLTVMFCDLVGSTALSTRLDPEDLRAIIKAYHRCCTELVERSGGFVAKYMGDGILAYFGYPRAHEHDGEQAVRAGLTLVEAVPKLEIGSATRLQVRVGIATGLVVVGDLIGAGAAQEQAVVGETPNLAARLQAIAEPGTVVTESSTRRLGGGLFEYRDLGSVELRGFVEKVRVWQVLGTGAVESRFEAQHPAELAPLIGREEELDLLQRRWRRANRGEGQVVILVGEPGIGKSRIAQTVQQRLRDEPHTLVRYFCSPHHQDSAFYPLIVQLERAAGFGREDTPEIKVAKLETILRRATDHPEEIDLIAELLSLPITGRYRLDQLSPQKRKEKTLEALLANIAGLGLQQPVLVLFEDVHWIDPSSMELLALLVERVSRLSVLLIITARPEFTPLWANEAHIVTVSLTRLNRHEGTALLRSVAGNKALPKEVTDQILARTDGVPLFVEELTRTVLESGLLRDESGTLVLTGPLPPLAIPTTLQASLLARLDRLAPVREVAQIAAALGRQFSHEIIALVAPIPEKELRDALDQLVTSELIFRRGAPPNAEYTFKHALVQDAAYSTLLRNQRQQLHSRIATTLDRQFPEIAANHPEIIARHYTEASLTETAVKWWRQAGERALHRSAYNEAIAHLEKALGIAADLVDKPEIHLLRLQLQTTYGYALLHGRGQAVPQTIAAFARAREFASLVEDAGERYSAYYGMWAVSIYRADLRSMRELAEAFLADVRRSPGAPGASVGYRISGLTCWFQGDYAGARAHLEQALAAYDEERDRHLASRFGYDPGVQAMLWLPAVLWACGVVDRAASLLEKALNLALQTGHIPTIMTAHSTTCQFAILRRKPSLAGVHAEAILELARERGLPLWLARATFYLGWARWYAGEREGETEMRDGIEMLHDLNVRLFEPIFGTVLAEVEADAGRVEDALVTLDAQFATLEETGERWFEAEMHRLRGELLFRSESPAGSAELALMHALDVARNQQTRTFELRAALSIAKIYAATGREHSIAEMLTPTLVGFKEGSEVPEVAEASGLLASVSQTASQRVSADRLP